MRQEGEIPELVRYYWETPKRGEERSQKLNQLRQTAGACLKEKGEVIPFKRIFKKYKLEVSYSDKSEERTAAVKVYTGRVGDILDWATNLEKKVGIFVEIVGSGEYLCIERDPGQSWIHVEGELRPVLTDEKIALYQELLDDISGR